MLYMANIEDCDALADVEGYTALEQIILSPNPTKDLVQITDSDNHQIDRIIVMNSMGQEIIHSIASTNIDLSD